MEEDKAAGVRTLAHSMGTAASRAAYALGVLAPPLAVACFAAGGVLRVSALVCLISLVPAVFLLRSVLGIRRAPDVDARTARYAALFFTTLLLGMSFPW
jgi:1,4-dihydroxy-2-naphthoate octaprenyltransferase